MINSTRIVSGGGSGGGLAVLAVYVAGRFGAHLTAEDGAAIATAAMAVGAFVAHNGLVGLARIVWHGEPVSRK